jgi:hypothetical protein
MKPLDYADIDDKFRRNSFAVNTRFMQTLKLFNIMGWYVNLPLCFGPDIVVGTQPV